MQIVNQSNMTFTKESNKKEFQIDYNFSFIKVCKIEMSSHWNSTPNDWGKVFSGTTLTFVFHKLDGTIESYPYNLLQFISVYQNMPVIELNFELPSKEIRASLTSFNYYKKIDIVFDIDSNESVIYKVLYEVSPGVTLIN
jgi:hypothetical protein